MEHRKLLIERRRLALEVRKVKADRERLSVDREKVNVEREKLSSDQKRSESQITNQYALEALRSVLLINGAACVAVLSFLGNATRTTANSIAMNDKVVWGALPFAFGVAFAAASSVLAYYSRISHRPLERKRAWTYGLEALAGLFGVAALVMFPFGAYTIASRIGPAAAAPPVVQSNVTIQ